MSLFPRNYTVSPSPGLSSNGFATPIMTPTAIPIASPALSMNAYPVAFTSPSFNRDPHPDDEFAMATYERRESPGYIPRKESGGSRNNSIASSPNQSYMRRGSPLGPSAGKFMSTAMSPSSSGSFMDRVAKSDLVPSFAVTPAGAGDYDEPKMSSYKATSPSSPSEKKTPPHLTTTWRKEKWNSYPQSSSPISPFTIVPTLGYAQAAAVATPGSPLRVSMVAETFADEEKIDGKPGAQAAKWGFTFNLPSMPQFDSSRLPQINLPSMPDIGSITMPSLSSPFTTPRPADSDMATFATNTRRSSSWDYTTYEACMLGAEQHEKRGKAMMGEISGDAVYELRRANEIYGSAMGFNVADAEPLIRKSRIVLALAAQFEAPQDGVTMLRDSASDLSQAIRTRALEETVDVYALQAETSTLLCKILLTTTSAITAAGDAATWTGEIGRAARSAVTLWEDAACLFISRIDDYSGSKQRQAAIQAADALMRLADAALIAARLAPRVDYMDSYHEVVEVALDQASAMVMLAKPSPCASGLANPFLTHVHLLSCKSKIARIQHGFALGVPFDEEEVRGIIVDVETLAERETRRAKSMKGSKAAGASASAFKAMKQLGDTKLAYANMLRHAWRNRKAETSRHVRSASNGSNHGAELVKRLSKPRFSTYEPVYSPDLTERSRTPSLESSTGRSTTEYSTDGSVSGLSMSLSETDAIEVARPSLPSMFDVDAGYPILSAVSHKRKSWISKGDPIIGRKARLASIGLPRNSILWKRNSSIIAFDCAAGPGVPHATDLVDSAWDLVEDAMKQYKVSLSLLAASNMPQAEMTTSKAEVLLAISDASLFQAMLSLRSLLAKERRAPCITTAEVYACWAAREVGWASVIEGSEAKRSTEQPPQSWHAIELGKTAVMTTLRVMWHRENENLETLSALRPVTEVSPEMRAVLGRLKKRIEVDSGASDDVEGRFRARTAVAEMAFGSKEKAFWGTFLKVASTESVV